jgi:hypothetical protein
MSIEFLKLFNGGQLSGAIKAAFRLADGLGVVDVDEQADRLCTISAHKRAEILAMAPLTDAEKAELDAKLKQIGDLAGDVVAALVRAKAR